MGYFLIFSQLCNLFLHVEKSADFVWIGNPLHKFSLFNLDICFRGYFFN